MHVFLIILMAFAAPLGGIAIFIVIDQALDKLLKRFKSKGR